MDKTKLLRKAIACYKIDTGYDMRYIAHKIGVSVSGLYDKISHPDKFRHGELLALVRLLRMDDTQKLQIMT
jgi:hypothetical protein